MELGVLLLGDGRILSVMQLSAFPIHSHLARLGHLKTEQAFPPRAMSLATGAVLKP